MSRALLQLTDVDQLSPALANVDQAVAVAWRARERAVATGRAVVAGGALTREEGEREERDEQCQSHEHRLQHGKKLRVT